MKNQPRCFKLTNPYRMRSGLRANTPRGAKGLMARHQRALISCREELQKGISSDFFKTHSFFFFKTPSESDYDAVSMFLDSMEQSDEATFKLFMDILKSYNRTLYHHLEQTLVSIDILDDDDDEDDCFLDTETLGTEKVAISGHMVKEVLRKKMKMKSNNVVFKNNPMADFDGGNLLSCFVVNSKGDDYQRSWLKHNTTRKKCLKSKTKPGEPYMAVICRDIVFKMISDVPPFVRKPVNCSQIYVCDDQITYSPIKKNNRFFSNDRCKDNILDEMNKSKKCMNQVIKRSVQSPPPLPPKPDTLSPLPTMSFNEKSQELTQKVISKSQKSSSSQRQFKTKLQHNPSIHSIPPPIPSRKKSEFTPKPPPASPPLTNTSTFSMESSKKHSTVSNLSKTSIINLSPIQNFFHDVESDAVSDDNVSLSYNVEPENSDELEEPYEPINPFQKPNHFSTSNQENTETLCFELTGKNALDSNTNNTDFQELSNYSNSSIEYNDSCNQNDQHNNTESGLIKNTKHDYLVLEANDHDLQANNLCHEIKDKNIFTMESQTDNQVNNITASEDNCKLQTPNKNSKSSSGLNQVFSDYAKILEDLKSSEVDSKTSTVCVDRSCSIKSEPANQKALEPIVTIADNKKISSLKSTLNRDIMELSDFHLMARSDFSKKSIEANVSVSRSSSGISATISERMATRDSGVDSTVSQNLHDSQLCVKEQMEHFDSSLPDSTAEEFLNKFIDENSTKPSEASYYEDIDHIQAANFDSLSQSHYLDPRMDYSKDNFSILSSNSNQKLISVGSLFITDGLLATTEDNFTNVKMNLANSSELENSLLFFTNTIIGYDKDGASYYVPLKCIKRHGETRDQPWFYPIPLTIKEASIFLKQEQQKGCFLVYKFQEETNVPEGCVYFLGLYSDDREVLHYPIVENVRGDFMIDGDDRSFLSVCELVLFYKRNRHRLATRLRRCLKESRMLITPGHHYMPNMELPKKAISLSNKVVCEGRFGPLCLATLYRQQHVIVRLFQKKATAENEDDFLNEALIMMETEHKNILRLLGVCFGSKPYYIVMEHFGIGTLKDALSHDMLPLDRNEIFYDICLQMTAALLYLEKKHFILHRNLSSSSFLISADHSIKLFNFEKAYQVDDDNYEGDCDEEISVRWAAPEVLVEHHYSTKSDVWALAVVFWELFSHGLQPYQCMSEQQVIVSVLEKCKLDKPIDCDNRLYNIMMQCWKFKLSSRPSFSMLEDRLKGQSSLYYMSSTKNPAGFSNSLHPFDSQKGSLLLPNRSNKRFSQASPTTPVIFGSPFQFRNSNFYTDAEIKGEDTMKISQIIAKNTKRHTLANKISSPFVDSSSSIHISNENVSRSSKERKSLKKFFRSKKNA